MRALIPVVFLVLAACDTREPEPEVEVCYFASGRPCHSDTFCMSERGAECNLGWCQDGEILSTAAGCNFREVPPLPGGPFDCDPTHIARGPVSFTPPLPCPLGSLHPVKNGQVNWQCVPLSQCKPIACDPAFGGDGCPVDHICDPASSTCVPEPIDPEVGVCHFPSGRPCREDAVCMSTQGSECNYVSCEYRQLRSTMADCSSEEVPPLPGGPFDCDPGLIVRMQGRLTPPSVRCPLGSLHRVENDTVDGPCVPLAQCKPIACDPAYGGDGCPSNYACDPASSTCVPPR
jgi:hypothetical protein